MKTKLMLCGLVVALHFCQLALSIYWIIQVFRNEDRAWEMAVAYDRYANVATNGDAKETISSRAYRGMLAGSKGWCILCRLLDFVQKDHCKLSAGE